MCAAYRTIHWSARWASVQPTECENRISVCETIKRAREQRGELYARFYHSLANACDARGGEGPGGTGGVLTKKTKAWMIMM